jgi:hypothetical protein
MTCTNVVQKIYALKYFFDLLDPKIAFVFGVACYNFVSTIVALSGGNPNPLALVRESRVCQ